MRFCRVPEGVGRFQTVLEVSLKGSRLGQCLAGSRGLHSMKHPYSPYISIAFMPKMLTNGMPPLCCGYRLSSAGD